MNDLNVRGSCTYCQMYSAVSLPIARVGDEAQAVVASIADICSCSWQSDLLVGVATRGPEHIQRFRCMKEIGFHIGVTQFTGRQPALEGACTQLVDCRSVRKLGSFRLQVHG